MPKVPPLPPSPLPVVVGFSARALAEATAANTHHPIAVDHFADHDCQQAAHASIKLHQWGGYVDSHWHVLSQLKAAGAQPGSPLLLGGGTENWPELVDLLHQHFTVLGPNVEQLQQLRSPEYWQACAAAAGVAFPETHWNVAELAKSFGHCNVAELAESFGRPAGGVRESAEGPAGHIEDWLIKPRRGAGGHAIRRANGLHTGPSSIENPHYWQRKIAGRSLGVYCVLAADGQVELLGATESLSAEQWPGPSEFIYRGSLGPINLADAQRQQIMRLCQVIQTTCHCLGWLQLDFIEDASGALWLLELNPRWAAGMEILFLAGINPVAYHYRAWQRPSNLPLPRSNIATLHRTDTNFAKSIVYADRELILTPERIERLQRLPRTAYADLPSHSDLLTESATKIIASGEPLLTVRASGPIECLLEHMSQLREIALELCHR